MDPGQLKWTLASPSLPPCVFLLSSVEAELIQLTTKLWDVLPSRCICTSGNIRKKKTRTPVQVSSRFLGLHAILLCLCSVFPLSRCLWEVQTFIYETSAVHIQEKLKSCEFMLPMVLSCPCDKGVNKNIEIRGNSNKRKSSTCLLSKRFVIYS